MAYFTRFTNFVPASFMNSDSGIHNSDLGMPMMLAGRSCLDSASVAWPFGSSAADR